MTADVGLWLSVHSTVSCRFHVQNDTHIGHCPLFSKCLPICEVSARSNVKEGEKKLNKSNLITNTQAAVTLT